MAEAEAAARRAVLEQLQSAQMAAAERTSGVYAELREAQANRRRPRVRRRWRGGGAAGGSRRVEEGREEGREEALAEAADALSWRVRVDGTGRVRHRGGKRPGGAEVAAAEAAKAEAEAAKARCSS